VKKILICLLIATSTLLFAKDFPSSTITIITSFPVGSGPDSYTRALTQSLEEILKVPVVLENRPGGNGSVSLQEYKNRVADGYSIYFTDPTVINAYPLVYGKSELIKNLTVLTASTSSDLMLISSTDIKNIQELQDLIKKHPYYGSWAIGSTGHIFSSQFAQYLGIDATHIPYKEYSTWLIDVSNKQLSFSFVTLASGKALEKAGKIKFLAIASQHRDADYPDVPTLDEFVGKKTNINGPKTGAAFYIDKSVPHDIQLILRNALNSAFNTENVKESIAVKNYKKWNASELDLNDDAERYRLLIKKLNINVGINGSTLE